MSDSIQSFVSLGSDATLTITASQEVKPGNVGANTTGITLASVYVNGANAMLVNDGHVYGALTVPAYAPSNYYPGRGGGGDRGPPRGGPSRIALDRGGAGRLGRENHGWLLRLMCVLKGLQRGLCQWAPLAEHCLHGWVRAR